MLLPKLSSLRQLSLRINVFEFISRISYSAYLVHMPMLFFFSGYTPSNALLLTLNYIAYLMVVALLSWLIYKFFEKPIMDRAADHLSSAIPYKKFSNS